MIIDAHHAPYVIQLSRVTSHEGEAPAKLIASSVPAVRAYDAMDIYVKVMI